jgi:thiamine kinase-like enzyme
MTDLGGVIDKIDEWKGKSLDVEELTAGITNKNYKVTIEGKSYVVRIPGAGTDLFIQRDIELHNTLEASRVGVGARVFKYFKESCIVISEFIHGEVMSVQRFQDPSRILRAVRAIFQVNNEAEFTSEFIMFDKFRDYHFLVQEHSMKLPDQFNDAVKIVRKVEKRFKVNMPALLSCHNDLLAENFIDMGDKMRIIDWELSGRNEPCFELGDFSVEQGFGDDVDTMIIENYFGQFDESKYARMKIYKSMADLLWTLWAMIQNHYSKLEFDFWAYGINRFNRAMNAVNSGDFSRWLAVA